MNEKRRGGGGGGGCPLPPTEAKSTASGASLLRKVGDVLFHLPSRRKSVILRGLSLALILAAAWLTLSVGPVAAARNHTFDRADLDTTCQPCQDFYRFATGGWAKRHPIQPSYATWGQFSALQDKNQQVLLKILQDAARAKNAAP